MTNLGAGAIAAQGATALATSLGQVGGGRNFNACWGWRVLLPEAALADTHPLLTLNQRDCMQAY